MRTGPLTQIMIYIYIRDEEPVPPYHYYTTIMSTVPISGSTLTIHTNKAAITGAIIIFNVTEEMTTCQLSFSPVIDPSCMPSIIIMTGIAASPTIDKVEWIASGTPIEK